MPKPVDVIKIGGSLVFDEPDSERVLREIFSTLRDDDSARMFVIGCGDRLHRMSEEEFRIHDDAADIDLRMEGYEKVRKEVRNNLEYVRKVASEYLPLRMVCPSDLFIKESSGDKNAHEIKIFNQKLFEEGDSSPLTSGGAVRDLKKTVTLISSDTIAAYLATRYSARKLLVLSDMPGVCDEKGCLIKEISINEYGGYGFIKGGMRDKIRRVRYAVDGGVPTYIASGKDRSNLFEIAKRNGGAYTKVVP